MTGTRYTTTEMIERLVGFDTTSSLSNMALIEFVRDYLAGLGVSAHVVPDPAGDKANLFATIGPNEAGGVALSGHTDVVPVAGQDWDSDPFRVVRRGDRLFGRGTADMKSFIAAVLVMVPEFLARDLKKPIHLAFSYDEETGCTGVQHMIAEFGDTLPMPAIVIVGEPTGMTVANAHKGGAGLTTTVTGVEAHSSLTHIGVNAIAAAAELIGVLGRIGRDLEARGDPANGFEPPYTTVSVGKIQGGTALNIIPKTCQFGWEFRNLPGDDPEEIPGRFNDYVEGDLLPRMRAVDPRAAVETELNVYVPPCRPEAESPAETLVKSLLGANRAHVVSYCTEAGLFQAAGASAVLCGPGHIAQAHQPNEFIDLEQVAACETFLRRLADWAAA